ncbi:MAG TPA: TOBE domain-containing protein, partial [Steroidobacteraceae bacterium]
RLGVMHQGRLLETGRSEKLYARPATRFVATFLGAANLFMGERSPRGLKLGEVLLAPSETLLPHSDDRAEVVTVVRPEDIEVADAPQHLASRVFAAGHVQTISFAGSIERLTVQLADHTSVLAATAPEDITAQPPLIETTRTRSEQSELALTVGRRVALGLRRFHVLPTPISSFVIATADAEQRARLEAAPLLAHLIASMRARVLESTPSAHGAGGPPQAGVVVVPKAQGSPRELAALIAGGASRILSLPEHCELPRQLLFYADTDASRTGALGLVASVMRHLTAAATLVTVQPTATPRTDVSIAFRRLLDARAELQAAHGLDIRTDVHLGELEDWVMGVAASAEPVLVILGIESESAVSEEQLRDRFRALLAPENRCAVLLAATRASNGAREFGAATLRPSSARA